MSEVKEVIFVRRVLYYISDRMTFEDFSEKYKSEGKTDEEIAVLWGKLVKEYKEKEEIRLEDDVEGDGAIEYCEGIDPYELWGKIEEIVEE